MTTFSPKTAKRTETPLPGVLPSDPRLRSRDSLQEFRNGNPAFRNGVARRVNGQRGGL